LHFDDRALEKVLSIFVAGSYVRSDPASPARWQRRQSLPY
jgi:hypothetical protein